MSINKGVDLTFLYSLSHTHTVNMFKRKSNDNDSEGAPAAKEQKVDPIPRQLHENTITLNFVQRSWEEIAPGMLYYLPLCATPKYMFDAAMKNQFFKFSDMWETMEIHQPKARFTNLIMLQDDLRVQNNTPTDATAFTQVVYMIKYSPVGQKQYFKLANVPDTENMGTTQTLTYNLAPPTTTEKKSQLVMISGFDTFDKMAILPAKANEFAGYEPKSSIKATNNVITDAYIAPNTTSGPFKMISANMSPADTASNYVPPTSVMTMCKNQDKISFYKYGDSFEVPIVTNVGGLRLEKSDNNNFLTDLNVNVTLPDKTQLAYATEWYYPSRNRPFLTRKNYYDADTLPITEGKKGFKPLNHCFLSMPPIKKPNGTLLGQRCSMILEQTVSITLHMSQATFMDGDDDDAMQVNQDNQIRLRRNIYSTPAVIPPSASVFCPPGKISGCKTKKKICYEDSWNGFYQFFIDNRQIVSSYAHPSKTTSPSPDSYDVYSEWPEGFINLKSLMDNPNKYPKFMDAWNKSRDGDLNLFWSKQPYIEENMAIFMAYKADDITQYLIFDHDKSKNYVIFDLHLFFNYFFATSNNVCLISAKADPVISKNAINFYV